MELTNTMYELGSTQEGIKALLLLLSPFAPHLTEELWQLGNKESIHKQPWPKYDPELVKESEKTIPIQVNGKLRDAVVVPADATEAMVKAAADKSEKVASFTNGKQIVKVIYVPGKMLNLVVK